MSSVKDNVGRGLNIALVNGEFAMMWGHSLVQERGNPAVTFSTPSPQGGGIWMFVLALPLPPLQNS